MNLSNCTGCGASMPPGAKFCSECGEPVQAGANSPNRAEPAGGTKVRDFAIVIGVLLVITVVYFAGREPATPPTAVAVSEAAEGHQPVEGADMSQAMEILKDLPADYASLVDLGNRFMDNANYAVAAECYRRALEIRSDEADVRVDYGACLHGMGLPHRAIEEFRAVLSAHPGHAIAHFNLGIVLDAIGETDSALTYWKGYLKLDPDGRASAMARQLIEDADD